MKKNTLLLVIHLFFLLNIYAQNVGIGTNAPDASSMLEIKSAVKGLLIPRMNSAVIPTISNPAKGLLVLDTATNQLMLNMGTAATPSWQNIVFKSGWSLTGNTNINPATNFIGTIDQQPLLFKVNNTLAGHVEVTAVSLGPYALISNTNGVYNMAIGTNALRFNTDGNENSAFGWSALYRNITGNGNTAVGSQTLTWNTAGSYNTAIGYTALLNNTTDNNTAMGYQALLSNSSGAANTATGSSALYQNTTGSYNTANGYRTLYSNNDGSFNTGVGYSSLTGNTNGSANTAIGSSALLLNDEGSYNTATGYGALLNNTAGNHNAAFGSNALQDNISASGNTALGSETLLQNKEGSANTAVGSGALRNNISGSTNTAIGFNALNNNTADDNIAVGANSLVNNTTGHNNTAIGYSTLINNNSGHFNTAVGYYAGNGLPDLQNNTTIGSFTFISNASGCTAIGYNASTMNTNNLIVLGSPSTALTGGYGPWTNYLSDGRFKNEISEEVKGLDFILRLRPITYHMDIRKLYNFWGISPYGQGKIKMDEKSVAFIDESIKKKEAIAMTGFIAQEVEKAADESGYNFDGVIKPSNDKDNYRIAYEEFVVPLVKAVQEQQKMIDDMKKEIEELKALIKASTEMQQNRN